MIDLHQVGFEKEAMFSSALLECRKAHDSFKAKTLKAALQVVCPRFMADLFDVRPCFRKLKFTGNNSLAENTLENDFDPFFKFGEIYESVSFNGATYQIKGYDGWIGCSYFEVYEAK